MNTIRQFSQYALQELKGSYPAYEIQNICKIIYMDVFHFTNIDIHLRKNEILDQRFSDKFSEIVLQLKSGLPIQYIIGETEFATLRFRLNSSTLIPRPETEELILWAQQHLHSGQKILDIGTGSGCIAITLAHACPEADISGIDISEEAVNTAISNAKQNQVKVRFQVRDILAAEKYSWPAYDLIISNPPYVRETEKKEMEAKVLNYEPSGALFVSDEQPLVFYEKIALFGQQYLKPQGLLFFEINEAFGTEMIELMKAHQYRDIELRKDFYGKDRMIKGKK